MIKNAVLSALLIAISRDGKFAPVLQQADLIAGCKLQMRGAMTANQRALGSDSHIYHEPTPLTELLLSAEIRGVVDTIVRYERARQRVYGTWTSSGEMECEGGSSSSSGSRSLAQRAAICTLAGPTGSGKRTLSRAIASELDRSLKTIHAADLIHGSDTGNALSRIQAVVNDARLADSVIAIDGFEHILAEGSSGGEGAWKMDMLLGRLMSVIHPFPGCVLLICHMDTSNMSLQKDFASRLFCFLRMGIPQYEIRAKLWERLVPARAPVAKDVNYNELGRRFELNAGGIRNAVARASAEAAMRGEGALASTSADRTSAAVSIVGGGSSLFALRQMDFMLSGEAETRKTRSGNYDSIEKLFL